MKDLDAMDAFTDKVMMRLAISSEINGNREEVQGIYDDADNNFRREMTDEMRKLAYVNECLNFTDTYLKCDSRENNNNNFLAELAEKNNRLCDFE